MSLTIEQLEARLYKFEAAQAVRTCMNSYMALCDVLDEGFDLAPLMALFTENAVWQGKGSRYANTFGAYEGRQAIEAMFAKYTKPPAHFVTNVHFLTNELIDVDGFEATGSWLLIQPSTFASGKSQLSTAKITAQFIREKDNVWKISSFQTENLFSRPMQDAWDNAAPLPVPE